MDFKYTEEQIEFRKQMARYVDERIIPIAAAFDESEEFPRGIFLELGELGYLGIKYPEQYGGTGLDQPHIYHTIFCEELARGSLGIAAGIAMHTSTATYGIYKWGSEDIKQRYLVPALQGKMIGAFALTEPSAGSDAAAVSTKAQRDGDHYVLNGTKIFTSNGTVADFVTVVARTSPGKGFKGISLFLVDTKTPGFSVGRRLKKFTTHCSDTAEIILENVRIPRDCLLGEENMGLINLNQSLVNDRIMTAGLAIGVAKAAYQAAFKYAKEREQFGQTISNFQAIRFRIVDMLSRLETSELYTYYAAWKADRGEDTACEAAMAKMVASEAANYICRKGLSIFGGYGLMEEFPMQRFLRDSFFPIVGGGTTDIMKVVIARAIGL